MNRLYFIRHAESEANKQRVLGSRQPYPLTDAGREDSRRIAAEFDKLCRVDGIISSPLLRAQQTAEAFAEVFGLTPKIDDRLSEQELGVFSGVSYDDVKTMDGYESDPLARWDWQPAGGGESYQMVARRVTDFLASLDSYPDSSSLLIVTHAVVFRLLRAALENTLPRYPKGFPNNGEIWKVDFTGLDRHHEIESIFLGRSREFQHNP